jgi:adenosine/AMP kinase
VEDLYETLVQSSPVLKFGIAFNEASPGYGTMPGRKVRFDGNEDSLIELAKTNAMALGAGHTFIIFMDGGFPVNCLNAIKAVRHRAQACMHADTGARLCAHVCQEKHAMPARLIVLAGARGVPHTLCHLQSHQCGSRTHI